MTVEREGKSISRGEISHDFCALAGGKYERMRSSRREGDEYSSFVEFLTSKRIVNLPPSDLLGSLLLRGW